MSSLNKIALITGGSRGLGRAMVEKIAQNKINIIFTYNSNQEEAENTKVLAEKLGVKAAYIKLNVGNTKGFDDFITDLKKVLSSFGKPSFNYLVNNAGTGLHKDFLKTTEDEFDEMVNVHFKGVYFLTQKLVPLIEDNGKIINISSGLTRFSTTNTSVYAPVKGAVEVFTRYLAKELQNRKITANVVAPGAIATDFNGGLVRSNKELNQMIANETALGRVGQASDIGSTVAALLNDDLGFINGQRIEVSGGIHL